MRAARENYPRKPREGELFRANGIIIWLSFVVLCKCRGDHHFPELFLRLVKVESVIEAVGQSGLGIVFFPAVF